MVEMTGFEPAASSSRTKRATKLRYISILILAYKHSLGEMAQGDISEGATNALIGADALRVAPLRYISVQPHYYSTRLAVCQCFFRLKSKNPLNSAH